MLNKEGGFAKKIPTAIKYYILADAGRRVKNDPFRNQKTAYLVQTYDEIGRAMASLSNDAEVGKAADAYVKMLDKFIEGYGLFRNKNVRISGGKTPAAPAAPSRPVSVSGKPGGPASAAAADGSSGAKGTGTAPASHETGEASAQQPLPELDQARIDEIMSELNQLVGLKTVKEEIFRLVDLLRVQRMRSEVGLQNKGTSRHMVFYGNPGTGKTTVARLLADIYRELGILPTGQLVEVDRSGLVGGYVGQTAIKTSEVIDQAMGGVLFIDEAYTLTANKGQNDFGQEAVDTILKAMEDYRDQMIVIVAGYTELMKEFLETNPGLKSRFNYFIEFPDYTPEELVAILELQCKKNEYTLSEAAREKAVALFTARCENKPENFANAREVRNFMEKAMLNHAGRVTKLPKKARTKKVLSLLEAEDLGEL
ncbi:MAG: AAA family ATPase [Lachnospiraceae bacterium]|nr:AAA family ATPase [Lachnospiraceae bacterium]